MSLFPKNQIWQKKLSKKTYMAKKSFRNKLFHIPFPKKYKYDKKTFHILFPNKTNTTKNVSKKNIYDKQHQSYLSARTLAPAGGGGQLPPVVMRSPGKRRRARLAMDAGDAMPVRAGGGHGARHTLRRAGRALRFARPRAP
jgi:hypothetical protein